MDENVLIPVKRRMNMGKTPGRDAMHSEHSLDGLKVLLAEDDPLNIIFAQKILSGWDIEVAIARNGLIAVEMAKKAIFDIILMDIQMPEMDGLAASIAIKKFKPKIPIIVLSSYISEQMQEDFNDAGITDFMSKPIDKVHLHSILVKNVLKK